MEDFSMKRDDPPPSAHAERGRVGRTGIYPEVIRFLAKFPNEWCRVWKNNTYSSARANVLNWSKKAHRAGYVVEWKVVEQDDGTALVYAKMKS